MEGIIFFWGRMAFLDYTTFFMKKKSPYRLKATVCILSFAYIVPYQLSFFGFQINIALLFLYMFSLFHVIQKKKLTSMYVFLSSFIIMLAYVSFLLFELFDPAWVILNDHLMLGFVLVYLSVLLHSDKITTILYHFHWSYSGRVTVFVDNKTIIFLHIQSVR